MYRFIKKYAYPPPAYVPAGSFVVAYGRPSRTAYAYFASARCARSFLRTAANGFLYRYVPGAPLKPV
jgi:hypothetical protein